MFEKPQKAQVVRIKIEAISLDSMSIAPSLDGPLLAALRHIGEWRNSIVIDRRRRCSPWKPCNAAVGPAVD